MMADSERRPVPFDGETLPAQLIFHARGHLTHAITGLGLGAMMFLVAGMMGREAIAAKPPDVSPIWPLLMPGFIFVTGLLLFLLGLVHVVRLARKPVAFIMDRDGVEGFLLFGRRRIAWRDITEIKRQGPWFHLHAGRKKLYISEDALQPVDGHPPGALIDYFLRGVLGADR